MKKYSVYALALNLQLLKSCRESLRTFDHVQSEIDSQFGKILSQILGTLKGLCEGIESDTSLVESMDKLSKKLESGEADLRISALLAQVDFITDGISNNMGKRLFLVLTDEELSFYNNPDVFGESFKAHYPARAMREVFDAGNCYAASLYTACVFHCMRVAEYGLRKLAANRTLRIKLTKKGKPYPIEYGVWSDVITAIQNKIKKVRQRPLGPKREEELQFLSSAADHCDYMREIWRNEVSHTRRAYSKPEALGVINRVKDFVTVVGKHRGSPIADDSIVRLLSKVDSPSLPPPSQLSNLAYLLQIKPQLPDNTGSPETTE